MGAAFSSGAELVVGMDAGQALAVSTAVLKATGRNALPLHHQVRARRQASFDPLTR